MSDCEARERVLRVTLFGDCGDGRDSDYLCVSLTLVTAEEDKMESQGEDEPFKQTIFVDAVICNHRIVCVFRLW